MTNSEFFILEQYLYNLPEIIAFSIANGLPDYLQWITSCITLKYFFPAFLFFLVSSLSQSILRTY
ncbi:MAG: divalent cation tolerance protein CutA [Methyloprofundus sp.]|nr:divalent cation tolerance protein CutA [Methyloprofundus sp.]